MRIIIFTTAYRPLIGGSEIALEEVIRRLPDIFFDIVTPRYKKEFKVFESGGNFNIHRVGLGFKTAKIAFPVLGFFKATKLMKDKTYNAAHAYQASYGGGAGWLVKIFHPSLPFILTMQEGKSLGRPSHILNWLRGLIIKKADVVTVISNYLRDYANKHSKNKNIFLIPNGVNLKNFQFSRQRNGQVISRFQSNFNFQNSKPEDTKTIITVSRLVPKNGLFDLIEALNILNGCHKDRYKLVIIGDGPLRESLKFKAKSLNLEDKINFVGKVPNEMIHQYLAQADVFVRPSLSEGLGTAFLEAMAVGLPVVTTPVGGIPDFLKDPSTHPEQATGLFCKVGDPADIADKIKTVLSNEELRNGLVLNGRKLVEERYTWDKIAIKFKELYDKFSNS